MGHKVVIPSGNIFIPTKAQELFQSKTFLMNKSEHRFLPKIPVKRLFVQQLSNKIAKARIMEDKLNRRNTLVSTFLTILKQSF